MSAAHGLMATLARHRRLAAAATLFSTALRTTRALNALLAALCSSSSSPPAPPFLRLAPRVLLLAAPHASPDDATFRILAGSLCRAGDPAAAADVLRCMPGLLLDPDPALCRAVLSSLCRCRRAAAAARDALTFLDDMRRWGVRPCRADHRAVIGALLRDGMAAEAYGAVVARREMDGDGVPPGLAELDAILRALSDAGDFDAVEEVFDEMLLRGLVPDVPVYNAYVGALCRKGDLAGARRMLGCMERAGCPPDSATFATVIAGCVSAGDLDAASEVAQEATTRGFTVPAPTCRPSSSAAAATDNTSTVSSTL